MDKLQRKRCPNPYCGAVFATSEGLLERFCTDCGTELTNGWPDLILMETRDPFGEHLEQLVLINLSHGSVRAPVAAFKELTQLDARFYLVMPFTQPFSGLEEIHSASRK